MELEINGITYVEKPQPKRIGNSYRSSLFDFYLPLALAEMAMFHTGTGQSSKASPPDVNIVTEYELIQHKKSNLSRSQREWVVNQFNRYFEIKQ